VDGNYSSLKKIPKIIWKMESSEHPFLSSLGCETSPALAFGLYVGNVHYASVFVYDNDDPVLAAAIQLVRR
jgi:hypothetical protein